MDKLSKNVIMGEVWGGGGGIANLSSDDVNCSGIGDNKM